ncbi:MAG TPA: DUF1501 domain-containing protein [Nannocystaceae bacterium]|nr:DUF1501 domain-containing protein [Nannocystaceae bacterium]
MKRRKFLKSAAIAGASASAGVFAILKYPRGARAAGWGVWPSDKMSSILPADYQVSRVLELNMNGGMNPWDTFYGVPDWGVDDFTFGNQFAPGAVGINPPQMSRDDRFAACGFAGDLFVPFNAADANGVDLFLGPWTFPFRDRPDILDRMRIVVQRHDVVAHEGANPLAFSGDRLGHPRLAGIGTAIQRYFSENPEAGGGLRAAPYSYVLYPGIGFSTFNSLSASAVGFHPGSARPLGVTVTPNSMLSQLLARTGPYDRAAFDEAITVYRQAYEARLKTGGVGAPTRSAERGNYEYADYSRRHAVELQTVLSQDLFQPIAPGAVECGAAMQQMYDMPQMQANLAANLLTRDTDEARYVLWIDAGINPHPNGGHDSHTLHTVQAAQNYPHTFRALANIIGDGPGQLSLDDTMIVINTEFGRTPGRQPEGGATGTNHWPWGYVSIFIGGPVRSRGCYGAITYAPGDVNTNGYASEYATPAENRMMVLQAMGIYPFSSQSYAVGDVRGGVTDEVEATTRVRDIYLGVG